MNRIPHTTDTVEINGKVYFTRHWMMTHDDTHHAYYAQLVTPGMKAAVREHFRKEWPAMVEAYRLNPETRFNSPITDINKWYQLNGWCRRECSILLTRLEYAEYPRFYWAEYHTPCILKTAARLAIAEESFK